VLEVIAKDLGFTEGPVAVPGGVAVCSNSHGAVYRLLDGQEPQRVGTGGGANGMTADASGALYVAQNGGAWAGEPCDAGVQRIVGDEVEYVVTGLSAPNDICIGPDGRLYFTDPRREGKPHEPDAGVPGRLYSCTVDGDDLRLLHEGLKFINGLAFDPSGTKLYLTATATRQILAADWVDGEVGDPQLVAALESGAPDGMAFDSEGNLWVAATLADALHVLSPEGAWIRSVDAPEGSFPTNCCFGGDDLRTLYVTGGRGGIVLQGRVDAPGLALNAG
jgi:gluconolactonase